MGRQLFFGAHQCGMLMNVSAGCLSTYIRPPVQTVVVSTKQTERFTLLVDAYIRQPVIPIQ